MANFLSSVVVGIASAHDVDVVVAVADVSCSMERKWKMLSPCLLLFLSLFGALGHYI